MESQNKQSPPDETEPKPDDGKYSSKHCGQHKVRSALFTATALYIFLYCGAFFGYGPMQLMLEDYGSFSSLCSEDEPYPCPDQTATLLNVQFVGQLTLISSPLLGASVDKFGPSVMIVVMFVFGASGLALLAAATYFRIDAILFPAFILLGFMANVGGLFTVQTGLTYQQGRDRNRAISGLNALFDAGAITYLLLYQIEQNSSLELPALTLIFLGLFVFIVGIAAICWRFVDRLIAKEDDSKNNVEDQEIPSNVDGDRVASGETAGITKDQEEAQSNLDDDMFVSDDIARLENPRESYIMIADRPPMKQFLSSNYIFLAFFFAFHQSRNIWVLTTTRDFLAYLGDDETGNRYLKIFTLLTPASVLGLPFVDIILQRYGYGVGLGVVNLLAIIQGIVQVSSSNLNVQIIGFVFYSFYRCFLFSVSFSCLPAFMSGEVVGKSYGFLILGGGLLALINIPLSNVAVQHLEGNFFVPNLFYLLACLPCFYCCYAIAKGFRGEKKEELVRLRQSKMISAG